VIRSVVTYAYPTLEYATGAHLFKLQGLQTRVLRAIGYFDRRTPVSKLHVALKISYMYECTTKLFRT
jgi:hypothetical protein